MSWNAQSRLWSLITVPPTLIGMALAFSLLGADQRLNLFIVVCCMLGAGPILIFHIYRTELRQRDRTESALRASEERYRRLVELSPNAIGVYTGGEILYSNRAWASLLGVGNPESLLVQPLLDFIHPDYRSGLKGALEQVRSRTGEPWPIEHRIARLDGTVIDVELSAIPFVYDGKEAVQVIVRDITKRKSDELKMQEALDAARDATRLKSEFLATMSHEIRTPMNGVLGMADLLLRTSLDESQAIYAGAIRDSSKALLNIVNDILDLARIESGKLNLECQAFDMREIVNGVVGLVSPRATAKGLKTMVWVDPRVPAALVGDGPRIRQVLTNLLDNAVKFTERGHLLLSADVEELTADSARIRLSAKDTGIGIPHGKLQEVFEKFTQADPSTTRKFGGSGLGLAICRELVEMMGGRIAARSSEGHGSEFWFTLTLPITTSLKNLAEACGTDSARNVEGIDSKVELDERQFDVRVLVAEDNAINQTVASHMLQRLGCTVDVAKDGNEVIQMLAGAKYDLVFMDCEMPGMDGFEATARIRNRETAEDRVPIVALTAHAMRGARERCFDAGMDDFVSKPLDMDGLRAVLERWVLPQNPQIENANVSHT